MYTLRVSFNVFWLNQTTNRRCRSKFDTNSWAYVCSVGGGMVGRQVVTVTDVYDSRNFAIIKQCVCSTCQSRRQFWWNNNIRVYSAARFERVNLDTTTICYICLVVDNWERDIGLGSGFAPIKKSAHPTICYTQSAKVTSCLHYDYQD